MKWSLVAFFISSVCFAQNQEASVTLGKIPMAGLLAYYPLNGNADDAVGNNTGTMVGESLSAAPDRFGRAGRALRFKDDSYVDIPVDINASEYPALTICAWAMLEGPANDGVAYQVLSHDDGEFDRGLGIDYRGGGVGWSAFAGSGDVLGSKLISRKWTFIAVIYDQNARSVTLFVNDRKFTTNGQTGLGTSVARIGASPTYGEFFPGLIDEVRIYGRALGDEEIKQVLSYREP